MRILGIDPGTGRTGYGVIDVTLLTKPAQAAITSESLFINPKMGSMHKSGVTKLIEFGCIETSKDDDMSQRLVQIRKRIKQLLTDFQPEVVSIELLFFGLNSRTAMTVGQARGVVIEAIAGENVPIFEYQGLMIKKTITGSGKADKKQMQELMRQFFGLETVPKPDDAADGLAIALCHALSVLEPQIL